jgi:hypothetical protein
MKIDEDFKKEIEMIDEKFWKKIEEEDLFRQKYENKKETLTDRYWVYKKIYGKHMFR